MVKIWLTAVSLLQQESRQQRSKHAPSLFFFLFLFYFLFLHSLKHNSGTYRLVNIIFIVSYLETPWLLFKHLHKDQWCTTFPKEQDETCPYTHTVTRTRTCTHKQNGNNTGLLLSQPFGRRERTSVKMSEQEKRSPGWGVLFSLSMGG